MKPLLLNNTMPLLYILCSFLSSVLGGWMMDQPMNGVKGVITFWTMIVAVGFVMAAIFTFIEINEPKGRRK